MSNQEVHIEISYLRRYITGQYQHKEYSVKITGNEEQLRQQLAEKQVAVAELVASLEGVVTMANQAAIAGKKVSDIVNETSEPKVISTPAKSVVVEEVKKPTAKKKTDDDIDLF